MGTTAQQKSLLPQHGVAPPVYRPNRNLAQPSIARPGAPPVYRPGIGNTTQPKVMAQGGAAPSVYRPAGSQTQPSVRKPGAPPVYRPAIRNATQLERLPGGGLRNVSVCQPLVLPGTPKIIQRSRSAESTAVRLKIQDTWYEGSTGQGHGHAEMDALHNYIEAKGGVEAAIKSFDRARTKTVECEDKPVCKRCTTVLETLNFKCSSGTVFSAESMGSTQWGASMNVKAFLNNYELDVDKISAS